MSYRQKNRLEQLPDEILCHIYSYVFDDCLGELKKTYSREWMNKYACQDCITYKNDLTYRYPKMHSFLCPECKLGLCSICYIRSCLFARLDGSGFDGYCVKCIQNKLR